MALEATLIIETEPPIPFTVADGAGIEKGTTLKITDPMTAVIAAGDADVMAGIAAEEKIANDGRTKLAVYRAGIFKVFCGAGGVTVGLAIVTDVGTGTANEYVDAGADDASIAGIALETATDGQSFLMELKPTSSNT